jgi:hypothetical protein
MISKCYIHPSETAVGKCDVCKKSVCRKCVNKREGKITCRNCVGKKPVSNADTDELDRQERLERERDQKRKSR